MRHFVLLFSAFLVLAQSSFVRAQDSSLLVLMQETGLEEEGLPVYTRHPAPDSASLVLLRGFSGTWIDLYAKAQHYRSRVDGVPVEPAYVLLSTRQGGFARQGFVLDGEVKRLTGYVDVKATWQLTGSFGAIDQIVPHELAHVLRRELAGELEGGGANQIHALGVRTDRVVAFNEGYAEHLQAAAFEYSPDVPALAALAVDQGKRQSAYSHLESYARELSARFAPASPMRMGFVGWFANDEDVLRYHAVVENSFANEPVIPNRMYGKQPYRVWLMENMLPGEPGAPSKSPSRMAASEAAVASFFYHWATDDRLGSSREDAAFYEMFGTTPEQVSDVENIYLKQFHVLRQIQPQTVYDMVNGYADLFPQDEQAVRDVAMAIFGDDLRSAPPELWMVNRDLEMGTTVFDQYRGMPRVATFDLNAASLGDLTSVQGVSMELARDIMDAAPFESFDAVGQVSGVDAELVDRFQAMHADMEVLEQELESEAALNLSIRSILMPSILRAVFVLILSGWIGTWLMVRVRRRVLLDPMKWYRLAWNGLWVALLASAGGWYFQMYGLGAVATLTVTVAIAAGAIQLIRSKDRRKAVAVFASWVVAALPAALVTGVWF